MRSLKVFCLTTLWVCVSCFAQEVFPVIRTPIKVDPKHPPRIGTAYYPPQSLRNREQGTCYIAVLVDADGSVSAMQLLKSSGYSRLDAACFSSFIDRPMIPATVDGKRITSWTAFPISWQITSDPKRITLHPPLDEFAVPRLPVDYELPVGPKFYPEAARAQREEGVCIVHVAVDAQGTVGDSHLSQSSGFNDLDHVCVDAVAHAPFTPEKQVGQPVESSTDIAIFWKLP
jgi:TonB family protein